MDEPHAIMNVLYAQEETIDTIRKLKEVFYIYNILIISNIKI